MITPSQILQKAKRKLTTVWRAEIQEKGDSLFPLLIPFRTPREKEMTWKQANDWKYELLSQSKRTKGFGYSVECQTRLFHGKNEIPTKIYFESAKDIYRFTSWTKEADAANNAYHLLTTHFPELKEWTIKNLKQLLQYNEEWPTIIKVLQAYLSTPHPNCFKREFAEAPHSKYLETHQKLLRELLDQVAAEHINPESEDFDLRFGFKKQPQTCWIRFLDPEYIPCGIPGDWMSLPFEAISKLQLPQKILIVENRIPLLSLPHYKDTLGIWGEGKAASLIARQNWLQNHEVYYWGDIDTHGLEILGEFRKNCPHVQSIAMNHEVLETFKSFSSTIDIQNPPLHPHLNETEEKLFLHLQTLNLRLEHERIPHTFILDLLLQKHGFELIEN